MHRYTATPRNNKGAHMAEVEWTEIKEPQDIKLVVADMDATLLDADGQIPAGFWPMLDRLNQKGVTFVPASGRQYQTLQQMFSRSVRPMSFIAENGNIVSLDGNVIETHTVSRDLVKQVIDICDKAAETGEYNIGLVVCGLNAAYIQRTDEEFIAEVSKYYAKVEPVNNLREVLDYVDEKFLKLAIFDFEPAEPMAMICSPASSSLTNTCSRASIGRTSWIRASPRETAWSYCRRRLAWVSTRPPCSATISTTCRCSNTRAIRSPWPTPTRRCARPPPTSRRRTLRRA